ncbi:MAG: DUF1016 N-terminal domain-containing protein, partial [Treponema sp.]|nr:DUF1016 N-terminal domain-containing protein [Treponema sp.]
MTNIDSAFFEGVAKIIEQARTYVGRTADLTMCVTYFEIGRMIVEEEQDGKTRAEYGRGLLKELSTFLEQRFGKGYSVSTLTNARKFYLTYLPSISQTMSTKSAGRKSPALFGRSYPFTLSWSHYLILMRVENEQERRFYEIEATRQQWTFRQLQRQYGSSLYERLALSRDK